MSDAPEKMFIAMHPVYGGSWRKAFDHPSEFFAGGYKPYIRADIYDTLKAENERLREALTEQEDEG